MSDFLTINETAEMFAVSPRTVRRWVDDGTVRAYRVGARLLRVDIDSVTGVYEAVSPKLQIRRQNPKILHAEPRSSKWKQREMRELREEQVQVIASQRLHANQSADGNHHSRPGESPEAAQLDI